MANTLSKVAIDIVTEFKGAQNLKKAQTELNGLDAAVNKLGKRLAATFGAAEILKFGKDSVAAFAADQASATSLAKTLKNVGQGFADLRVEKFIKNTETATGVVDEKLRPAFETLVRATGDYTKAQDLLTLSLDVAQGSGKDLATVSSALGKAYLGQTTALSKLGVGLTAAQLKGKSFADIQKQLKQLFGGQAAAFADTYAGKIQKIGTAWDNVKETIGKGLIDAFTKLSQNTSIDSFTTQMQTTATAVADIARGISDIGTSIRNLPALGLLGTLASTAYKYSFLGYLQSRGAKDRTAAENLAASAASQISTRGAGRLANETMADTIKKQKEEAANLAKSNAEKAKQLKLESAIAYLKKSMAIFDMQKIQIAAALQNKKLTADEENRLKLMQAQADLQQAIDDKNVAALDPLMQKIADLNKAIQDLSKLSIGNPFQAATNGAIAMQSALYGLNAALQAGRGTNPLGGAYDLSNYASVPLPGASSTAPTVNVTVQGSVISSGDLVSAVQQGIVNNTAGGSPSNYARNLGAPLRDSW